MPTFTLVHSAGFDLGHSRWIEIDQPRIDAFAEVTEDRQWIHVDVTRAADGPFGTTIAHGYLTLSLVAGFLDEIFRLEAVGMSINYGLNRVRFPQPVPSGGRVRGRGEVMSVESASTGLQVTVQVTVEIDGVDRPACVAEALIRVMPAIANATP